MGLTREFLLSWDFISLASITLTAFAFAGLERLFPYDKGQKTLRDGFWLDMVAYGFFQGYVLGKLIFWIIDEIEAATHLRRLHLVSDWPVWLQLLFFFVVHDFYIYWFHRAQHRNRYLWRLHEAHHSVKDVDWLAGTRSHSLEILINQTIEFAPIVLLGGHPALVPLKAMIDALWGMYIHSNVNVRTGVLQRVLNGPEMHRWHHNADWSKGTFNFSTKLAVWDWLFGTAYLPREKPAGYGLGEGVDFPTGYVGQHLHAFRPFPPTETEVREPAAESPAE